MIVCLGPHEHGRVGLERSEPPKFAAPQGGAVRTARRKR